MAEPRSKAVRDEPPPFLSTWRSVYIAVVVYLAVIILLFALFTRYYAP